MAIIVDTTTSGARGRISAAGWAGVLGAPAIWFLQQSSIYALTQWVCLSGKVAVLVLITVACLIGAVACGFFSWRSWKRSDDESPDETDGGPIARSRFLGALGLIVSLMFFVLIFAQGIPSFFFDPCWT
jgi:hypothetical protein